MPMIRGKAYWAKIVGKPQKAYNPGEFEWSIDVSVDEATRKQLISEGLGDKVKNKGDDRGDFIQFKRNAFKKDPATGLRTEPSKPIRIVDHHGNEWGNQLIGNGSTVNVKYAINEFPIPGGKKGRKQSVLAIQVWDLVKYERTGGDEDFPISKEGKEEW